MHGTVVITNGTVRLSEIGYLVSSDPEQCPDVEPPQRRKRDSARTRREILSAAGRNFARRGYSMVPLQQIANEAGITPALIVRMFGSKMGLFREVARDEWDLSDRPDRTFPTLIEPAADLARAIIDYWNDRDARSPSLALVRSLDIDESAELFRLEIQRRLLSPLLPHIHGDGADERSRLIVGLTMGFGYFTTGALLDPDAPPLDAEQISVMEKYLTDILSVILRPT
ncbi:MAG: TetR family transcriptional regulator [Mycobacterium sp.]|nr:TetR family transcriptional regulator [Mycobacterium sp.]